MEMEGREQSSVTPISEGSDDKSTAVAEVFVAVGQHGVDHAGDHVTLLLVEK